MPTDKSSVIFLGVHSSEGERPFTEEEKDRFMKDRDEIAYKNRKELKDTSGITSLEHSKLDEWVDKILPEKTLSQLERYRNDFAHRLDSLDKLKSDFLIKKPNYIDEMLNIVSEVLNEYYKCLKDILVYTKSEQYLGIKFKYDSLSRLKQYDCQSSMSGRAK